LKGQRSKGTVAFKTLRKWETLQRRDVPFPPLALLLQKGATHSFQGVCCGAPAVLPGLLLPITLKHTATRLPQALLQQEMRLHIGPELLYVGLCEVSLEE